MILGTGEKGTLQLYHTLALQTSGIFPRQQSSKQKWIIRHEERIIFSTTLLCYAIDDDQWPGKLTSGRKGLFARINVQTPDIARFIALNKPLHNQNAWYIYIKGLDILPLPMLWTIRQASILDQTWGIYVLYDFNKGRKGQLLWIFPPWTLGPSGVLHGLNLGVLLIVQSSCQWGRDKARSLLG
jgi:hypothetical protein